MFLHYANKTLPPDRITSTVATYAQNTFVSLIGPHTLC